MRHLTSIRELTRDSAIELLSDATELRAVNERELKKLPTLRGKTVVNLFFENSTRTRISFEIAASRLSADVINFSAASSSVSKGESLKDTAQTLEALGAAAVVIRHPHAGAASNLAYRGWLGASVINAGDGGHEHPTQALLDALTIRDGLGLSAESGLDGVKVLIVGDIAHSRVARSNTLLLNLLGAEVTVAGPPELVPSGFSELGANVAVNFDEALEKSPEVVMMLRVQRERMTDDLDAASYVKNWSLSAARAARLGPQTQLLHPGPMNRGFEISSAAADGPNSRVLDQVRNGLAVRMAVLNRCLSGQGVA
jgi:aspartate carbamoyltransferase catalytic subunit